MNFGAEFSIHPTLLKLQEVQAVFRSITNKKPIEDGRPTTMSFSEFEEALFRIAIKAGDVCNQLYIYQSKKDATKGDQAYTKIMNDYQQNRKKSDDDQEGEEDDEYEKIDETTMQTILGFFFFLDFPKDKQPLADKLNTLRSTVVPFNEKKKSIFVKMLIKIEI